MSTDSVIHGLDTVKGKCHNISSLFVCYCRSGSVASRTLKAFVINPYLV